MDFTAPISTLMSRKLVTVTPGDRIADIKEIFDHHSIHHIPVVKYKTLVGIISKSDFLLFLQDENNPSYSKVTEQCRQYNYKVEDIMTTGIATLESTDRMNVALQLFSENLFHAIPVVDEDELVGMLTTFDIIKALLEEDNSRIMANRISTVST
ncbi:MAG: CBS domain-containing protein [Saprospiraceae bacterium]